MKFGEVNNPKLWKNNWKWLNGLQICLIKELTAISNSQYSSKIIVLFWEQSIIYKTISREIILLCKKNNSIWLAITLNMIDNPKTIMSAVYPPGAKSTGRCIHRIPLKHQSEIFRRNFFEFSPLQPFSVFSFYFSLFESVASPGFFRGRRPCLLKDITPRRRGSGRRQPPDGNEFKIFQTKPNNGKVSGN